MFISLLKSILWRTKDLLERRFSEPEYNTDASFREGCVVGHLELRNDSQDLLFLGTSVKEEESSSPSIMRRIVTHLFPYSLLGWSILSEKLLASSEEWYGAFYWWITLSNRYCPTKFTKGVSRFLLLYPHTAKNRVFQPFCGILGENCNFDKCFYRKELPKRKSRFWFVSKPAFKFALAEQSRYNLRIYLEGC